MGRFKYLFSLNKLREKMDKVQKWLAEKEEKMPSENHQSSKLGLAVYRARRAVSTNVRHFAGKIGSGIAHQYKLMTNMGYGMDYGYRIRQEKEDNQRLGELRADGFEPEEYFDSQWNKLDAEVRAKIETRYGAKKWTKGRFDSDSKNVGLGSLVKAAREDEFAWNSILRKDNLAKLYEERRAAWKTQGYEYDSDGKVLGKIEDIRKNAYRKARVKQAKELKSKITNRTLGSHDVTSVLAKESLYCKVLGEVPSLRKELSDVYVNEVPFVDASEFYKNHPEVSIVHGICDGINANNRAISFNGVDERGVWRDLFDYFIERKPAASCSVVNSESGINRFYSPMGVIVGNGRIYDASQRDKVTTAFTPEMRISMDGIKSKPEIQASLEELVGGINPDTYIDYNEVVVGQPETRGIFYTVNSQDEVHLKFSSIPIWDVAQYALDRKLPFFIFRQGKGFTKVNPADYSDKTKLIKENVAA